ncbi:MAG: alpha/beta fold hydrolase [Actinobacteria bacterium]|nr:alpha/beta fold hydrolase [Actinomycetota bacterium]
MLSSDIRLLSAAAPGESPSVELAATLYLPRASDDAAGWSARDATPGVPGLIVGHGAGSRRTRHLEFCQEACSRGFAVLGLDFRGHGESDGLVDGPLELDLYAAATYLRAHPAVDPEAICYRGSSMGGFYGLKAAPHACFAAMALICPATEPVLLHALDEWEEAPEAEGSHETRWDVPKLRHYLEKQDCLVLAQTVKCSVLLIHARDDEVVPFTHTLLLTQSLPVDTTLLALAGGTHTTAQHDPCIHRQTIDWLIRQLTSCSAHT